MKAYLEVIVITKKDGGDPRSSLSQQVLEFESYDRYIIFRDQLDNYEKLAGVEIYRSITQM